jgi:hypothetical protein
MIVVNLRGRDVLVMKEILNRFDGDASASSLHSEGIFSY